ncbi:hypothetical protein EVAR_72821_1 [Eumeta japonica]|uniref:Uncharacterized protein n=1 Tax=Eumeta variegata TaxID=151549 RepID=A0A4C1SGR8_EUMVA|nr:hypothetical protein EVAR_72821_1 [Eumeta japonica]
MGRNRISDRRGEEHWRGEGGDGEGSGPPKLSITGRKEMEETATSYLYCVRAWCRISRTDPLLYNIQRNWPQHGSATYSEKIRKEKTDGQTDAKVIL